MSMRSFGAGARASSAVCAALSKTSSSQLRCFSITPSTQAHAIAFTPSSSSELDEILATIRRKILLPSYLPKEQQKKLFSKRHEHKLRGDPITIEIDGEVLKFTHMDLFRDVPNARRTMWQAISKMETKEDWENLPRLLEGYHGAQRRLFPQDYCKIARVAGQKGQIYTVIECARMAKKTGFLLDNAELAAEILLQLQQKAVSSGFEKHETAQALRWTEMVISLLEDPKHGQSKKNNKKNTELSERQFPLARNPQLLACRLHLAAALAAKHGHSEELDKRLVQYATEIQKLWPSGARLVDIFSEEAVAKDDGEAVYLRDHNRRLQFLVHIVYGFDMTAQALEGEASELVHQLEPTRAAVRKELEALRQDVGAERLGSSLYQQVFEPVESVEGATH